MDSGFLYALIDKTDEYSQEVNQALIDVYEEVIFPVPAETAYFVSRNLGANSLANFLADIPKMGLIFETPTFEDYTRSAEILRKYNDANIDFVDACIVAMAERLNVTKILTVDRRHFSVFKPKHCKSFEILP